VTARSRSVLLLAVGTAVTLQFGLHAVAPALPLVQEVFAIGDFQVAWLTSAYVLPGVLLAVPLGVLADLWGRRPVLIGAGLLYGVVGSAQAFAPTYEWLIAGRLVQGVAFAALMPLTVTLIGDAYEGIAQVRGQARRQIAMALANLTFPVIGAQLALLSWSFPFAIQGLMVVPAFVALAVLDSGKPLGMERVGYAGRALRSVVRKGFPSVLLLGFVRFVGKFSLIGYLPIHLSRELELPLSTIGVVMGLATGLGFASASVTARLVERSVPSWVSTIALSVGGVGLLSFAGASSISLVFATAVGVGLADGFVAVLQSAYAARGTPDDVRAGLVAVNGTARNGGKFVGPIVVGALAGWVGIDGGLAVVGCLLILSAFLLRPGLSRFDARIQGRSPMKEAS
jgi:ACDE family multidrug resistance protein